MNEMIQPVTHHLKIKCNNPKFISLAHSQIYATATMTLWPRPCFY